jgi:hypothetical protein
MMHGSTKLKFIRYDVHRFCCHSLLLDYHPVALILLNNDGNEPEERQMAHLVAQIAISSEI